MTAHRYWRVNVTAVVAGIPSIGEISMAASIGGANLAVFHASRALASSDQGTGFNADKAYDLNTGTYWGAASGLPAWWQYQFASALALREVRIQNMPYTSPSYAPATWDLQSSPDGATWTTVQSYTSATWTSLGIQTFAVSPSTPQPYWRVLIHTNDAGNYAGMSEIAMTDVTGGANLLVPLTISYAASAEDASHTARDAIDGNPSTYWGSGGGTTSPQWWSYDFGTAQDIVEVQITDLALNSGYAPTAFDLQFSDDNTTWTTLQSFTAAAWSGGRTQIFDVSGALPPAGHIGFFRGVF